MLRCVFYFSTCIYYMIKQINSCFSAHTKAAKSKCIERAISWCKLRNYAWLTCPLTGSNHKWQKSIWGGGGLNVSYLTLPPLKQCHPWYLTMLNKCSLCPCNTALEFLELNPEGGDQSDFTYYVHAIFSDPDLQRYLSSVQLIAS